MRPWPGWLRAWALALPLMGGALMAAWPAAAATYFLDAQAGQDANSGLSPGQAWRSLARLEAQALAPGDQVLFKRGSSWPSRLAPGQSGQPERPIRYGAYGHGPAPLFRLSPDSAAPRPLPRLEHLVVEDLAFAGGGDPGHGLLDLRVGRLSDLTVSRCRFGDTAGYGLKVYGLGGPLAGIRVWDCRLEGIQRNAIDINGAQASALGEVSLLSNQVRGQPGQRGNGAYIEGFSHGRLLIAGNALHTLGRCGIWLQAGRGGEVRVLANLVGNWSLDQRDYGGLHVLDTLGGDHLVRGNVFLLGRGRYDSHAIYLDTLAPQASARVDYNLCMLNRGAGLGLVNVSRAVLLHNILVDNGSEGQDGGGIYFWAKNHELASRRNLLAGNLVVMSGRKPGQSLVLKQFAFANQLLGNAFLSLGPCASPWLNNAADSALLLADNQQSAPPDCQGLLWLGRAYPSLAQCPPAQLAR